MNIPVCDIVVIGVNATSPQYALFEKVALKLSNLFSNIDPQTNTSVLFRLVRPVSLMLGADAACSEVLDKLFALSTRCRQSGNLAIIAFFGRGEVGESGLCLKCTDGYLSTNRMHTLMSGVERLCYILHCDYASTFVNTIRSLKSNGQKVAVLASTQDYPLIVYLPVQKWVDLFAEALLRCPITDLDYSPCEGLEAGDLVVTLTLWFETTQAHFANAQSQICNFGNQEIEWYVSPKFTLLENIIAHNKLLDHSERTKTTLLVS